MHTAEEGVYSFFLITHEGSQSISNWCSEGAYLTGLCSQYGCSEVPKDGFKDQFMASREKISSDPLLVEIT